MCLVCAPGWINTDADIRGQRFDEEYINTICKTRGLFIAHNAGYDRPKLERRFPIFQRTAWACSQRDINWIRHGVVDTKLRLLAMDLGGFHFHGHQAEDDSLALLEILTKPLPGTQQTVFQQLLARARSTKTRLYAIDAPFEKKAALKAVGFTWQNSSPKSGYHGHSCENAR